MKKMSMYFYEVIHLMTLIIFIFFENANDF